jgi:enediyne polyketide synthase
LALKDAGLDFDVLDRTRAGVMLGNSLTGEFSRAHNLRLRWPYVERSLSRSLRDQGMDEENIGRVLVAYRQSFESPFPEANEDTLAGNMANTIAGRVCNHFDFGGGGFTVDGACSSSLLGVVIACDALVKGDLDFAVAGGVDVSLDPFEIVGFAKTQALAKEDIRPYDERAGGMLTGEGCGIVVLMREEDARARGLRIHALLKGWAYSSDGKGGITAPEVEGQARALDRAYERAGYPMSSVGYIEGHGTGTPVGDKVELTAIQRILGSNGGHIQCRIGSIKANIGHCKAAAGAAGLIKAIQALKHKILPPTVNCERPIKLFSEAGGRLRPSLKGGVWEANGSPRRASVSSMGFGGANSHVTLEEASPDDAPSAENLKLLGSHQSSELILSPRRIRTRFCGKCATCCPLPNAFATPS